MALVKVKEGNTKPRTPKQKLAINRNFFKFRLLGCLPSSYGGFLTDNEKKHLHDMHEARRKLLQGWDLESKKLGIKTRGQS